MSDSHGHHGNHPYHLVDPSPWPILGAFAGGVTAVGMVMFMHYGMWWLLAAGLGLVLVTMFVWWRDVVDEAQFKKLHTQVVQIGLRYGMALFIASEVMFFAAFFWAFFNASLFPPVIEEGVVAPFVPGTVGTWPPPGIQVFDAFDIPFLNTLILLLSGVTVTWAHHALREGDRTGTIQGLAITVLLGLTFTSLQAYEYAHAAFGFREGIYSSTFYMATGFHGFHVIVGTAFLAVNLVRAINGHFSPGQHVGFEAAAWYWHFVDVVWLFLFVWVYWWGGSGGAVAAH